MWSPNRRVLPCTTPAKSASSPVPFVAVYDFGGGTFDAAVLRRTEDGFELIGTPEGLDRVGGIDVDEAVFAHVDAMTGGQIQNMDPTDPHDVSAVADLRVKLPRRQGGTLG